MRMFAKAQSRRLKLLHVTPELVLAGLFRQKPLTVEGMPVGCAVRNVSYEWARDCFVFLLEHESFGEVPVGEVPPMLTPVVREAEITDYDRAAALAVHSGEAATLVERLRRERRFICLRRPTSDLPKLHSPFYVDAVSPHAFFNCDQMLFRLVSPRFPALGFGQQAHVFDSIEELVSKYGPDPTADAAALSGDALRDVVLNAQHFSPAFAEACQQELNRRTNPFYSRPNNA